MFVVSYYTIQPNSGRYNVTNLHTQNNYGSTNGINTNSNTLVATAAAGGAASSSNNTLNSDNTHSSHT